MILLFEEMFVFVVPFEEIIILNNGDLFVFMKLISAMPEYSEIFTSIVGGCLIEKLNLTFVYVFQFAVGSGVGVGEGKD